MEKAIMLYCQLVPMMTFGTSSLQRHCEPPLGDAAVQDRRTQRADLDRHVARAPFTISLRALQQAAEKGPG
jgi:hypothetical protein